MQIIIISGDNTGHKHWHLGRARILLIATVMLILLATSSYALVKWVNPPAPSDRNLHFPTAQLITTPAIHKPISINTTENETLEGFYAQQLGGLQAEAIRLKMLSQRLAEIAGIEINEFEMGLEPGMGGIEREGALLSNEEFEQGLVALGEQFADQQDTLTALQEYLLTNDNITAAIPTGRPVEEGWISSFYGYRVDPFNGKKVFHDGLDFAGKEGSSVLSAADGIVSWAGMRGGYGGLVEIDHGNGYMTRYAHNKLLKVKSGDRVSKGSLIALMGSTGRSTGPHVHFEVLKNGTPVNPYNYTD